MMFLGKKLTKGRNIHWVTLRKLFLLEIERNKEKKRNTEQIYSKEWFFLLEFKRRKKRNTEQIYTKEWFFFIRILLEGKREIQNS